MLALTLDPKGPRLDKNYPAPRRQSGEALIGMRLCGVCDTDLQLAAGYMNFTGVPGHEFVGEVLEADEADWVGKRVVADINAGCGKCETCLSEGAHHCPNRTVLGILGRPGAFAEQLAMPQVCLVEVPDAISDEQAVFAEPLAAALHVLDTMKFAPRARPSVAVLGDGKLGLLTAMALAGAGLPVTSIGHHPQKLLLLPDTVTRKLERDLDGERFEVVVEATGSPRGLERALRLTRPQGVLVLKTTVKDGFSIDLSPIVINEITLVGSRCGNLRQAIEALGRHELDPTPLISERYPLVQAPIALARARTAGVLKVLIEGGSQAPNSNPARHQRPD